jgi:hypothetical protein
MRRLSECGLAIYIKNYLKEKERIREIQIFHHFGYLQKNL